LGLGAVPQDRSSATPYIGDKTSCTANHHMRSRYPALFIGSYSHKKQKELWLVQFCGKFSQGKTTDELNLN
jgi:hypothetical protein